MWGCCTTTPGWSPSLCLPIPSSAPYSQYLLLSWEVRVVHALQLVTWVHDDASTPHLSARDAGLVAFLCSSGLNKA